MSIENLHIVAIVVDKSIQPRAKGLNESHVENLKLAYENEEEVPRPVVWKIGNVFKLSQGFHRIEAATRAGLKHIECTVHTGTELECAIDAFTSNPDHGLTRTPDDIKRAVVELTERCKDWSDRRMAEKLKIHHATVAKYRPQLDTVSSSNSTEDKKVGKDGKARQQKRTPSATKKPETAGTPTPDASTNQQTLDGRASGDGGTPDADPFASAIPAKEASPDDPPFDPRFMPNAEEAVKIAATFKNLVARLRAVRTDLRGLKLDRNHPVAKRIDVGETDAYLGQVIETLDKNIPAHVCPVCCGTGDKDTKVRCDICDGYGVIDSHCHGGTKPKWKKNAARLAELAAAADRGDAA